MSENTSRFNNESEQMPLDATEASDFLAHSITSRLQRMTLSPWLQRALQSDGDTGNEGGGGILNRLGRRTAVSTQHTLTMVNRVEQSSDRSIVWRANVGSIEPAIEGFTDKIVGRFATTESKYLVQKAEEEEGQPKQGQGSDMVFADYGGAPSTSTSGSTTGSPSTRRGAFDVNTLPEIPDHIKAQHLANRAASAPPSEPISLTPSPKSASTSSKPAAPQRPLTPEERRKMRLYSRVEYVTPGSAAPETPQAHPLAEPSLPESQEVAPTAASPMPELPPGLTPVSEPVEEPKWRTRPRARVDYVTPRGDSPKSAEESAPVASSPIEELAVEAASEEGLPTASAEAVQLQEDEELTLRPRSRHRETPDSSEGEGKQAAPTMEAAPATSAPVQREEQPAIPTVPSEETVPQAAQSVQPTVAAPQPEQRVQLAPTPTTEQEQSDTPSLGPVVLQRESAAPEAIELPLHPRQRQRESQEASPATEATPPPPASQVEEPASPSAATPAVQHHVEAPSAPEKKVASAAPSPIESAATPVEVPYAEERPTLPATPSAQRQAETDQPLDMPLRPRVRPTASNEPDTTALPSDTAPLTVAPEGGETSRPTPAPREVSTTPQEAIRRPAQPVEAKGEAVQATPQPTLASDESAPRAPEVAERGTAPQPIQRQVEAEETLDLPLRPRTRPRKAQVEATETPTATPAPYQPEVAGEVARPTSQPVAQESVATPTQAVAPVQRQEEAATPSTTTPVQRQAETTTPSTATPVQREEEAALPRAVLPVQRQTESQEGMELPLRPRGRRVASQVPSELPAVEQVGPNEPIAPSASVIRAEEAPQASPSRPTVQRAAAEPTAPTTPSQSVEVSQASQPASTPIVEQPTLTTPPITIERQAESAAERSTLPSAPVSIERQAESAFEVPELPLRVRPRFQAAEPEEETRVLPERMASQPAATPERPAQAPLSVAAAEQPDVTETSNTPAPTPVRAQARKSSPASQKAVQRKVAQATESGAVPKVSGVQRQPTRAQAMPLRPRRRVIAPSEVEGEAGQSMTEASTRLSKPMVRRAEVEATSQPSTSQPVRVQRRAQSAKSALPLRSRTPQRVIVEEQLAEEYGAQVNEPNQTAPVQLAVALPTETPTVQRVVERAAATPESWDRPTAAPTRSESVQRAERVERPTEPTPSLPLRAVRRRQPDAMDEAAASPLADELVARLAAQSQLPLSGPQGARAQRVAQGQPDGKAAPKRALPKATRVQREPAKETSKVVAKRARPAIQGYEDATAQLAMAGWRFKRHAGATVSDPGLISRSVDNLVQRSDTGRALDAGTRATMEGALGRDFSQVRVHNVQLSPLNVQAASEGRNVYFEPGKDRFDTPESLSLLGHELTHVAQAGFAQTKSVVQTAILPQARVQRSEAADEADADQGERSVMEYLRRPQMAQLMPLVNEAPSSSSRSDSGLSSASGDNGATVQRSALSHTDMPVVQRAETGGDGSGSTTSTTQAEASGGEEGKKDEKDPAEKAKELTKLARQLYPLIKRMLTVERERHSGI